ncbi:hypothetical protein Pmar_PMAR013417, partial [Perkinsus marinus ATCC 50983]
DQSRQLLISLFPELDELNGSSITNKQRIAAERYVLHRHCSRDDRSIADANTSTGGRLIERLEEIHTHFVEANQVGEVETTRENKIGKTLLVLKIFPLDSKQPIDVRVPSSMRVADLRLLVYKRTRWPLDFDNLALQLGDDVLSTNHLITSVDDSDEVSSIITDKVNSTSIRPIVWEASVIS